MCENDILLHRQWVTKLHAVQSARCMLWCTYTNWACFAYSFTYWLELYMDSIMHAEYHAWQKANAHVLWCIFPYTSYARAQRFFLDDLIYCLSKCPTWKAISVSLITHHVKYWLTLCIAVCIQGWCGLGSLAQVIKWLVLKLDRIKLLA